MILHCVACGRLMDKEHSIAKYCCSRCCWIDKRGSYWSRFTLRVWGCNNLFCKIKADALRGRGF